MEPKYLDPFPVRKENSSKCNRRRLFENKANIYPQEIRLLQNLRKNLSVVIGLFLLVLFFPYKGSLCTQKTQFMASLGSCNNEKESGLEVRRLKN